MSGPVVAGVNRHHHPGGRLVFHVFASLAEFERDLIRERTQAGLAAARARGRRGGAAHGAEPGQAQASHPHDHRGDTDRRGRPSARGLPVHAVPTVAADARTRDVNGWTSSRRGQDPVREQGQQRQPG